MSDRIGNWMQTIGGRAFYPLDPHPSDIDIMDIGCALSMLCRFGGHCNRFYSVAEHSFRVSKAIEEAGGTKDEMFAGLMHDAAEAYVGDMVWPVKQAMPEYKRIEKLVEQAIAMKFDLPDPMPPIVKRFDLIVLATEKRDLMINGSGRERGATLEAAAAREKLGEWHCDKFEPLSEQIVPISQESAKARFLDRFFDLRGVK